MMSPEERARRVDKYFVPLPRPPKRALLVTCSISGSLSIVVALINLRSITGGARTSGWSGLINWTFIIIGTCMAAYGILRLSLDQIQFLDQMDHALPRARDEDMDRWLDEAIGQALRTAATKFDMHPDDVDLQGSTTLWFDGVPDFDRWDVQAARGSDGRLRYSVYPILVAFLSPWRLATYECVYSLRLSAFLTDFRKEYHLRQTDGMELTSNRISMELPVAVHSQSNNFHVSTRIVEFTSVQRLHLVISGRRAVTLNMKYEVGDQVYFQGSPRSRNDEFVAVLREHFRHHMGGVTELDPNADLPLQPRQSAEISGGRSIGQIVSDLREAALQGDAGIAATIVFADGAEMKLQDDELLLGAIKFLDLSTGVPDTLSSHIIEANAVAIMNSLDVAPVASCFLTGRPVVDLTERLRLESLLRAGSQLHFFQEAEYVGTCFGEETKVDFGQT